MKYEMDFLPASYRVDHDQRRARQWSLLLAIVVGCGILLTEGVLRYRLQGLKGTRYHARQQADAAVLRSAHTDALHHRHREAIEELDEWAAPLRTRRATEILDGILTSRPPSMLLQQVDWNAGLLEEGAGAPTLRIAGVVQNLGDIVNFLVAIEQAGGLPRLEIRQSGISGVPTNHSLQAFVVESATAGEGRR